jgi:hypothetical protein
VRVLDGVASMDSPDYQDIILWIREHLRWSVVSWESCSSGCTTEHSMLLDLMMNDPESELLTETFGVSALRCRVSFGNPNSELVGVPSFEWLDLENS